MKSGLGRITENTEKYQGVIVYNMGDVPLVGLVAIALSHISGTKFSLVIQPTLKAEGNVNIALEKSSFTLVNYYKFYDSTIIYFWTILYSHTNMDFISKG